MNETARLKYLRLALRVFGVFWILGVYPVLNWLWPAGTYRLLNDKLVWRLTGRWWYIWSA